jgi:tetratricopeptide (TPR) repeat protein
MAIPTLAEFEFEIGARMARGDFIGAGAAAAACRAALPSQSAGWLLGSFAALCANQAENALELIDECLARDSHNVQFILQQAECLCAMGRRDAAIAALQKVPAGPNAGAAALEAAGQILANMRAYREALALYDRGVEIAPQDVPLWMKRAFLHRVLGQFDLAMIDYEAVLALAPLNGDALKGLVELDSQTAERNHLPALNAALARVAPSSPDAAVLHFALAKSHEDLGEYATGWGHLCEGNRKERARSQYSLERDRAVIEEIIHGFPQIEAIRPDLTRERPIFIVGLPRTGTTLLERIIGSHSQVYAAGELPALSQAIGSALNPLPSGPSRSWREFAARLGSLDAETIARQYLALAHPQRGTRARFSDKQPTNFFYCALILRAFPRAHIVHATRHPLAACYAIYKTQFDAGFPFAYDLDELADFYIGYRRLMAHWHQVLPGRILDVAYEDMVGAQEATTRRLLEYLELPFEQDCLDFHLSAEPTTNRASSRQVRQPLYDSSLDQWKHYAEQLGPLRARLSGAGIDVVD